VSRDTGPAIQPVRVRKEKFTRMLRNGSESKMEHEPKGAKAKAKVKAKGVEKERKAGWATGTPNPFATIGARGMGTAAMQQLAISPTMVLKVGRKEKGKMGQHHCRPKS
jgi:hypothetical protein